MVFVSARLLCLICIVFYLSGCVPTVTHHGCSFSDETLSLIKEDESTEAYVRGLLDTPTTSIVHLDDTLSLYYVNYKLSKRAIFNPVMRDLNVYEFRFDKDRLLIEIWHSEMTDPDALVYDADIIEMEKSEVGFLRDFFDSVKKRFTVS